MSIEDLRNEILGINQISPAYIAKMCHKVPDAPVVDRVKFILERCKGKVVLNLGCASGQLHETIGQVAKNLHGIDREVCGHEGCVRMDLDDVTEKVLPEFDNLCFDIVVVGEVLEHLSNFGHLLQRLHQYKSPLLITVPNAYSVAGYVNMKKGIENVNVDHLAWFSWRTLKTLIERYKYQIKEWAWCGGNPLFAEGIIFVVELSP